MRINTNKINKVFENLNNKNQIDGFLKQRDKDNEAIYVVPFHFEPIGTANTTEYGMVDYNFDINSFTSYAKLITGLNNVMVKWDGAYNVYIDEEAIKDLPDEEKYITKEYKAGRVIKCSGYEDNTGSNTIPSPIDASFKQIEIIESVVLRTNEKLDTSDIFKVYLIPQKNKWRWLYIPANGLTEYYDKNGTYLGAQITLTSVNSLWSTSGGAIEQFIQKSAPGEGFAFPKWNDQINKIELNEELTKDLPIQAAQREYSGAAAFNTLFCYGRPTIQEKQPDGTIQNTFNNKIKASRLLLPYKIQTPQISPINTKPSAETDYYVSVDSKPTMEQYYKDWKDQFTANYDLSLRQKYEGVLELPPIAQLEQTNPLDPADTGTHRYILWDNTFRVRYNNETFNTQTNKLTGDNIVLNGDYTIAELLAQNAFITNHLITLPMNANTNTTWNLKDVPLIGGFLNTLTLGIPIGWTNTKARVQMGRVMLLTPANLVKYGNQIILNKTKSFIPFDLLQENTAGLIEHSGIGGMGSSIKVLLTDQFLKNGKRYSTIQLGQKQPDGTILKWDGSCKPVAPEGTAGYVIDALVDRTISKTDCRTVFFSSGYEVYQSTYKTKSKFTNEIRDWTNEIHFSSWNVEKGVIGFPAIIQQPIPPQVQAPTIEINDLYNERFLIDDLSRSIAENNFFLNTRNTKYVDPQQRLFKDFRRTINRNYAKENFNDAHYAPIRSLRKFTYDYTNVAPNISQLAFLYEELALNMFGQTKKILINDLIGAVKEITFLENWNATTKYRINYVVGPTDTTQANKAVFRKVLNKMKIKLVIDALNEVGKINFELIAYDMVVFPLTANTTSDVEQEVIFEYLGGSSGPSKVIHELQNTGGGTYLWAIYTNTAPNQIHLTTSNNITNELGQSIKSNFTFNGAKITLIPKNE